MCVFVQLKMKTEIKVLCVSRKKNEWQKSCKGVNCGTLSWKDWADRLSVVDEAYCWLLLVYDNFFSSLYEKRAFVHRLRTTISFFAWAALPAVHSVFQTDNMISSWLRHSGDCALPGWENCWIKRCMTWRTVSVNSETSDAKRQSFQGY